MHFPARLSCGLALLLLAATSVSAQTWKVEEEESITLQYRDAKDEGSLLEIFCERKGSAIVVPVGDGIKPGATPAALTMTFARSSEKLPLKTELCERNECANRANGEVSVYTIHRKGKELALKAATATRFAITAAGASLDIPADARVFAKFIALCRKHK